MNTYSESKQRQIEALKRLAIRHQPKEPMERNVPRYRIDEVLSQLDRIKPPCGQGDIHHPYYRECIQTLTSGKPVDWAAVIIRIECENPGYTYVG